MRVTPPVGPESLARILTGDLGLLPSAPLSVAYSGGLDSHVLLHAAAALPRLDAWRVSAIHVDHGLHPGSHAWTAHCREVCERLGIPLIVERVRVEGIAEHGMEAAARRARYAAFKRQLPAGSVFLSAHHRDDQAETLLLQLLRGAGVAGLAGMPALAPLGRARIARPLLDYTRRDLRDYAERAGLVWIEDPSNRDAGIARNHLRLEILPRIAARWPEVSQQFGRSARHCGQASALLDEIAEEDLARCAAGPAVSIAGLQLLSRARQANVLRFWLRRRLSQSPPEHVLDALLAQVVRCPRTGHAAIRWPGFEVRRYRDRLLARPLSERSAVGEAEQTWEPGTTVDLAGGGRLTARPGVGEGLARERVAGKRLSIRPRQGGERCRLPGRSYRHRVKKLLQEAGIPPWERARLPLLYVEGELAAIGDRFVCEPFAARPGEPSWLLHIEHPD